MNYQKNTDLNKLYGESYTSRIQRLTNSSPEEVIYISPEPWKEFDDFKKTLENILLKQNYNISPDPEVNGWFQAKKDNTHIEYTVADKPFPVKNDSPGVSFCIKAKILLPQIENEEHIQLIKSLTPYGIDHEYLLHYEDVHNTPFPF